MKDISNKITDKDLNLFHWNELSKKDRNKIYDHPKYLTEFKEKLEIRLKIFSEHEDYFMTDEP